MELSLQTLLSSCPVGQKRTAKYKQFVFLAGENVYKGPYNPDKIQTILNRSMRFREYNLPFILHPINYFSIHEGHFIIFPNIAKDYPIETYVNKESFTDLSYNVIKRTSVIKASDFLKEYDCDWFYIQVPNIALTLIYMYIFNVGDVGLYNILVDIKKKYIYIIDYDENRTSENNTELFYFAKDPAEAIRTKWLAHVRPYYKLLAEKITQIKCDASMSVKLVKALQFLNSTNTLGKMEYKGIFKGTYTFSGYELDVMKSALQKYIRRGNPNKALQCALEMNLLETVGGKAAQTNMYHRLEIIAAEDIGLANLSLVIGALELLQKDNRTLEELETVVLLLTYSKKTRVMSHFYRAFMTNEGRSLLERYGLKLEESYTEEDLKFVNDNIASIKLKDDPEHIFLYALIFYKRLKERNWNALNWLFHYQNVTQNVKVQTRNRRKNPMTIIWQLLSKELDPKVHAILSYQYWSKTEGRPFLMLAILIPLLNITYRESTILLTDGSCINGYLSEMQNKTYKLELDSYVYDKHTAAGKRMGKGRSEFVNEGALIENEDMTLRNDILYKIYMSS